MKVLVIDDHPLVHEALRNILQHLDQNVQIAEAADADSGLALAHGELDLVLLDLMLPGVNGMSVLTELQRRCPAVPVIVLSSANDRETVELAIRRGAAGFILKSASRDAMLGTMRAVLAGEVCVPPETMLDRFRPVETRRNSSSAHISYAQLSPIQRRNALRIGLTEREIDVLDRLMAGDANKTIADALNITESTIKAHCTTIFRLLRVRSRTQALAKISQGLLDV